MLICISNLVVVPSFYKAILKSNKLLKFKLQGGWSELLVKTGAILVIFTQVQKNQNKTKETKAPLCNPDRNEDSHFSLNVPDGTLGVLNAGGDSEIVVGWDGSTEHPKKQHNKSREAEGRGEEWILLCSLHGLQQAGVTQKGGSLDPD